VARVVLNRACAAWTKRRLPFAARQPAVRVDERDLPRNCSGSIGEKVARTWEPVGTRCGWRAACNLPSGEALGPQMLTESAFHEASSATSDRGVGAQVFGYPGHPPEASSRGRVRLLFTRNLVERVNKTEHHNSSGKDRRTAESSSNGTPTDTYNGDSQPARVSGGARPIKGQGSFGQLVVSLRPWGDGGGRPEPLEIDDLESARRLRTLDRGSSLGSSLGRADAEFFREASRPEAHYPDDVVGRALLDCIEGRTRRSHGPTRERRAAGVCAREVWSVGPEARLPGGEWRRLEAPAAQSSTNSSPGRHRWGYGWDGRRRIERSSRFAGALNASPNRCWTRGGAGCRGTD